MSDRRRRVRIVNRRRIAADASNTNVLAPLPLTWEAVPERAEKLAEQLQPLPVALGEIANALSRHCAVTTRDAQLARAVELVRGRTWDLQLAIHQLAEAAGGKAGAGT
jgi:hypothetical protein